MQTRPFHWLLAQLFSYLALRHGRAQGWYRRICQPNGLQWAQFLQKHGGLYAMGKDCCIQSNVTFTDPLHVRLGSNVHLTGCTLFGHDGSIGMVKKMTGLPLDSVGKIEIHDNVFVGHQAIIMPGVSIGPNAIVAAGAVVTHDVLPNTIVAGVPAKVIGSLDEFVSRRQRATAQLPWHKHTALAVNYLGPAPSDLSAQRIQYFFAAQSKSDAGLSNQPSLSSVAHNAVEVTP